MAQHPGIYHTDSCDDRNFRTALCAWFSFLPVTLALITLKP